MTNVPCNESHGPPCDALVHDPMAVLAEPDRWPDHICEAVARETTRRWAQGKVEAHFEDGSIPDAARVWTASWPLPVGEGATGVPRCLLPLPLRANAVLILEPDIPFSSVTAFGIIDEHPTVRLATDGEYESLPATMQFMTAGWLIESVSDFQKWAAKWWRGQNAFGRPRGSAFSRTDAMNAYIAYHHELGRYPTQVELAVMEELNCNQRTVRAVVGPWKRFEADARAWQEHVEQLRRQLPTHEELVAKRQSGKKLR